MPIWGRQNFQTPGPINIEFGMGVHVGHSTLKPKFITITQLGTSWRMREISLAWFWADRTIGRAFGTLRRQSVCRL